MSGVPTALAGEQRDGHSSHTQKAGAVRKKAALKSYFDICDRVACLSPLPSPPPPPGSSATPQPSSSSSPSCTRPPPPRRNDKLAYAVTSCWCRSPSRIARGAIWSDVLCTMRQETGLTCGVYRQLINLIIILSCYYIELRLDTKGLADENICSIPPHRIPIIMCWGCVFVLDAASKWYM